MLGSLQGSGDAPANAADDCLEAAVAAGAAVPAVLATADIMLEAADITEAPVQEQSAADGASPAAENAAATEVGAEAASAADECLTPELGGSRANILDSRAGGTGSETAINDIPGPGVTHQMS